MAQRGSAEQDSGPNKRKQEKCPACGGITSCVRRAIGPGAIFGEALLHVSEHVGGETLLATAGNEIGGGAPAPLGHRGDPGYVDGAGIARRDPLEPRGALLEHHPLCRLSASLHCAKPTWGSCGASFSARSRRSSISRFSLGDKADGPSSNALASIVTL